MSYFSHKTSSKIKIYVRLKNQEVQETFIDENEDIDGLKKLVLHGGEGRQYYRVYYKSVRLSPDQQVPHDTTFREPIHIQHIRQDQPNQQNSIYLQLITPQTLTEDEIREFSYQYKILAGTKDISQNESLDKCFITIVEEPLNEFILVDFAAKCYSLKAYVIDSLKRYNALNDILAIFPQCADVKNAFNGNKSNLNSFVTLLGLITNRTLLTTTIECLSLESQRFLGPFIRKNDLPIPLSYFIWNETNQTILQKINFNCLIDLLCFSSDRLIIQIGSKQCFRQGKTSLLPFIFTDKRRQSSLSTNSTDAHLRNGCIDVIFSSKAKKSYVIFDVHGYTNDENNWKLIRSIQIYSSLQIFYITCEDLQNDNDFLDHMMLNNRSIPVIICVFDRNYDSEDSQNSIILHARNQYSNKYWSSLVHWTTVPFMNCNDHINDVKQKRRAQRLTASFNDLFEEFENKINHQSLFQSIFAIQSTFLEMNQGKNSLHRHTIQFEVEYQMKKLFDKLNDKTENLSIITPISYFKSQIDMIKKQLSTETSDLQTTTSLNEKLKQLELTQKSNNYISEHIKFMIELLTKRTYVEILIVDIYLEQWRNQYLPKLYENKELIKQSTYKIDQHLVYHTEELEKRRIRDPLDNQPSTKHSSLINESKKLKDDINHIDIQLSNVDITIGLLCDELFALYEFFFNDQPTSLEERKDQFELIAQKLSELVYKGFAIHLLRNRPLLCQSGLIKMCLKHLQIINNDHLAVLTVVGEQSSAKSSLLNATFGCNFRVSAGRCTIGMYLGVAYYKTFTIIILDTEGLLSLEESGTNFDNQMITMAVLSSHIVLVNHKGELSTSLENLIGMSLYAKVQLKSSPFKPKLVFVLRDQTERKKKDVFTEQLNRFKDNLLHSSRFLKMSISDELEIESDNIILLPSAFSEDISKELYLEQRWRNDIFPQNINELRQNIYRSLQQQILQDKLGHHDFDSVYEKAVNNW
ncbi:unnamed protein product, partial [Adineta ricciae]